MKLSKQLITICLLLGFTTTAYAQNESQLTRSAGKLVENDNIDLMSEVKLREPVESFVSENELTGDASVEQDSEEQTTLSNRHDQYFTIYNANVSLLSDLDYDGYHHAFNVRFDVDVSYESATVYAKLYLSRDGAPWSQYHTTDLFNIYGDDFSDAYEVTTELIDNYPQGNYRILIEVFSLNHVGIVTSEVLDYYYLGQDVLLEDLNRDDSDYYYVEEVSYSHGGVGSFSMIWLLLLTLRRYMSYSGLQERVRSRRGLQLMVIPLVKVATQSWRFIEAPNWLKIRKKGHRVPAHGRCYRNLLENDYSGVPMPCRGQAHDG